MGFTIAYKIFNFNREGSWSIAPNDFNVVNNTIYVYKDKDFEEKVFITFNYSPIVNTIPDEYWPLMDSGSYTLTNFRTNSTEFSVTPKSINNSSSTTGILGGYKITDDHYINVARKL